MTTSPVTVPAEGEAAEPGAPSRARPPVAALGFLLACLLMAFAQVAASGMKFKTLSLGAVTADFALGAKVSSLIRAGEYWRLVTSAFLHADWSHLVMNGVALVALGMAVEAAFGRVRTFVIIALACVTGSIASYIYTPAISMGISAGLMGLFGALVAHDVRYRYRLPVHAQRRLPALLWVLAFITIAESGLPHIDRAGHAGGFFGGLLVGFLLAGRIEAEEQAARDWLPLPTGIATAVGLLAYGLGGLLLSLPGNSDLLRAAQTANPGDQGRYLERVIARRPELRELRLALCNSLLDAGDGVGAAREFERLIQEQPGTVDSGPGKFTLALLINWHWERVQSLLRADKWEEALPLLETIIRHEFRPMQKAEAYNSYAWGLVDKLERDLDKAEEYAQRATDLSPKTPAYIDTLAWVYYKQGRYREALEQQQFALRESSQAERTQPAVSAELYYHLGAILEKLGRGKEAEANYVAALRFQPRFAPAREALKRVAPDRPETREPRPWDGPPSPRREDPILERGIL